MADNRVIHSAVRIGDETYGPGREDELSEKMDKDMMKRLFDAGAIEGDFKAGGTAAQQSSDAAEKASVPNAPRR